ncbi:MAG: alpha/beta hydrolase family protein, partial [Acidimicrobiales bacterium]
TLHYVSDRSGWWNLYDEGGRPLAAAAAELAGADWAFGQSSFCFLADGRAVAAWFRGGRGELGLVEDGELRPVELGYRSFWSLAALGTDVVAIAGSPTRAPAVVRIDVEAASVDVLRSSRQLDLPPGCLSAPEALELPAEGGRSVHVLLYRPRNEGFSGPPGERPPLIVRCHGGPTAAASLVLDVGLQLWTSRGFAVVDVDYGGSTGYGREYRDRLAGAWGVVDVDDCVSAARQLAAMGEVDGERMVIRGASAGGYTTLAALTFRDVFAAGACLYGVGDLESLARDTHKFESRYLDGLVGPYPQAAELYRSRSPIHFVDRIRCPVILFQGLDDAIVPPSQSQSIADRLADRGVPVAYLAFEGEQHGFRRAETIVAVAKAELAFYGRALGFAPADDLPEVPIVNESALRRGG